MNISDIISGTHDLINKATTTELAVAIIAVLLVSILLFKLMSSTTKSLTSKKGSLALIMGPSGSGKTALFYKWSMPEIKVKTVTSQALQRGKVLACSSLEIVDYPGHPRLGLGVLSLLDKAQKIVFLLDTSAGDFKLAAEQLYELLVAKELRPDAKLMICRNKTDLKESKSEQAIVRILNEELEKLRNSRTQHLEGEHPTEQYLGVSDEKFDLMIHSPVDVVFGSISVSKGKVEDVEMFLAD